MSHQRNLKYQFYNIINKNFKESMDKHAMKHTSKDNSKIYSYSDRKNLIDLSSNFSNYIKKNHPEVKMLKDITSDHIQKFLNSKIDCSQRTLEQYQSHFRKLETLASTTYNINVNYHSAITPLSLKNGGGKVRNIMLSDNDYNKMLCTTNLNLKKALILSKHFGLRASECSKLRYMDITENGVNIIDSKGKRSRFIPAETQQQKNALVQFQGQGRVCPIQTASLQQSFNREAHKKCINISNGAFHTLRKNYATTKFLEYRAQGLSVQQSLDKTSHMLGHGSNRNELMQEYICCQIK